MIGDYYKASIQPAEIQLSTADGSPMSSMGKVTLHLGRPILNVHTLSSYVKDYQKQIFFLALTYRNGIPYSIIETQTDISSYKRKAHS